MVFGNEVVASSLNLDLFVFTTNSEDKVLEYYKRSAGQTRGESIVR